MSDGAFNVGEAGAVLRRHGNILWALLMRELSTRYGRNNLGFLWVLGEPLLFCGAIVLLWHAIKPPYEHGIKIIPFVITGYMPTILVRHVVSHGMNAVRVNTGLLYHRQITVLHLFVSRMTLEFIGVTLAFALIWGVFQMYGLVDAPQNLGLLYAGWFLMSWLALGVALILGSLAEIYEFIDRFVPVITYVLVPVSGTFYMAAWLPPAFRKAVLILPFLHPVEMIRGGFFGASTHVYFNVAYVSGWAAAMTFLGLVLARFVRSRVDIE